MRHGDKLSAILYADLLSRSLIYMNTPYFDGRVVSPPICRTGDLEPNVFFSPIAVLPHAACGFIVGPKSCQPTKTMQQGSIF